MKLSTTRKSLSLLSLLLFFGGAQIGQADDTIDPSAPLYRNGGYFGPAGSDDALEYGNSAQVASATTQPKAKPGSTQSTYIGTLFRNGGHFGENNSDQKLESGDR